MRILTYLLAAVLLVACGGPKPDPASRHAAEHDFSEANVCTTCAMADTAACCPSEPSDAELAPPDTAPSSLPASLPRLLEFGRGTCASCKTMKAVLEPMIPEFAGRVEIAIISVDDDPELTRRFRIITIPTQVFVDAEGAERFRHIGVYPRDSIVARFEEYGWK